MKVIDLLNKIANGEQAPKYINYTHKAFGKDTMMVCKENIINKLDIGAIELNDEVEILETTINTKNMNITPFEIKNNEIVGTWKNGNPYHYTLSAPQKVLAEKMLEIIEVINERDMNISTLKEDKIEKLPIGLMQTTDGIYNTLVKNEVQHKLNDKEETICCKINEIIEVINEKDK